VSANFYRLLLGTVLAGVLLYTAASASGAVVIRDATVIDPSRAQLLEHALILVEGDRIRKVGREGDLAIPPGAQVINATGRYVVPGFIDGHVHYREWMPELLLHYGVTSVIDLGNPLEWILAQREGVATGHIPGPRIFSGASSAVFENEAEGDPRRILQAVDALADRGVDLIRIGPKLSPESLQALIGEAHRRGLPVAGNPLYLRTALAAGIDFVQHSYTLALALNAKDNELEQIRRGKIEEEKFFFPSGDSTDLLTLMVSRRAYYNPVLASDWKVMHGGRAEIEREDLLLLKNPGLQYLPIADLEARLNNHSDFGIPRLYQPKIKFGSLEVDSPSYKRFQNAFHSYEKFLKAFSDASGRLVVGSDSPNYVLPGISVHQEMELLVSLGLSPHHALKAATVNPATVLRRDHELGKIEEGYLADLLILRKNPLEDIRNTREIEVVMKAGQIVDASWHASFRNPIPRPPDLPEYTANPIPLIQNLQPSVAVQGTGDLQLQITGRNFLPGAEVDSQGTRLPIVSLSGNKIVASCPSRLLSRVGTFAVKVVNPLPGGGDSLPAYFIVKFPAQAAPEDHHAQQ
jgi:amidohydrolase family protein